MDIKWEQQTGRHQAGEWARVGRVIVGSAGYSGLGSKDDPNKYVCSCELPGIKQPAERYATIGEAKSRLERMVRAWFSWTQQDPSAPT